MKRHPGTEFLTSLSCFIFILLSSARAQQITDLAAGPYPWYRGINSPVVVYTNNMIFFAFHGGQPAWMDPLVMKYDYTTGLIEGPVNVGDNLLAPVSDSHGAPALQVDRAGYIHVIYGGHGWWNPYMRHAVSQKPFDITAWNHRSNIESNATYPTLYNIPGNQMFYFYREGNIINNHRTNWVFTCSSDNGFTWTSPEKLLLGGAMRTDGVYFATNAYYDGWYGNMREISGELHYLVQYHPCICAEMSDSSAEDRRRLHIYYLRRDTNGIWRAPNGIGRYPPFSREDMDAWFRIKTSDPQTGSNEFESISYRDFELTCTSEPLVLYRSGHYEDGHEVAKCMIAWGNTNGTFTMTNAPYTWFMRPSPTNSNTVDFYGDWGIYRSTNRCRSYNQIADPFSAVRTTGMIKIPGAPDSAFILSMQPITTNDTCNTNALKLYLWGTNGFITPQTSDQLYAVPGTEHFNTVGFGSVATVSNTIACIYGTRTNVFFQEYDPAQNAWFNLESIHNGNNPGCITDSNLVHAGGVSIAVTTGGLYHILWNEAPEVGAGSFNLIWMKGQPEAWGAAERVLRSATIPNNRFPRLLYDPTRDRIIATWIATGTNSQFIAEWSPSADGAAVSNAMHSAVTYAYGTTPWAPNIAWNPNGEAPATVAQVVTGGSKADIWFAQHQAGGWSASPEQVNSTPDNHDRYPVLAFLPDGDAGVLYESVTANGTLLGFSTHRLSGWTHVFLDHSAVPMDVIAANRSNTFLAIVSSTNWQNSGAATGLNLLRLEAVSGAVLDFQRLDEGTPDIMGAHLLKTSDDHIIAIWQRTDDMGGKSLFYSRLLPCGAADNDADHLPDSWEMEYGGMTNLQSGFHDFDDDGMSDSAEYIAGSLPDDASSVFHLESTGESLEEGVIIAWNGLAGRFYTLMETTNILDPSAWTRVSGATALPGIDDIMTYTDRTERVYGLYRIVTELDE